MFCLYSPTFMAKSLACKCVNVFGCTCCVLTVCSECLYLPEIIKRPTECVQEAPASPPQDTPYLYHLNRKYGVRQQPSNKITKDNSPINKMKSCK